MNIKKVYFAKVTDLYEGRKYIRISCENPFFVGPNICVPVNKDRASFDELYDFIHDTGGVIAFTYESVNGKPFPVLLDISTERGDANG